MGVTRTDWGIAGGLFWIPFIGAAMAGIYIGRKILQARRASDTAGVERLEVERREVERREAELRSLSGC